MKASKISVLLVLLMVLSVIPFTALTVSAETGYAVYVGGVKMSGGDYLAVGATEVSKIKPETGGFAYLSDYGVLNLCDFEYTGAGYEYDDGQYAVIYSDEEVYMYLSGHNRLIQTEENGDGICSMSSVVYINAVYKSPEETSLFISADGYGIFSRIAVWIGENTEIVSNHRAIKIGETGVYTEVASNCRILASKTVDGELQEVEKIEGVQKHVQVIRAYLFIGNVKMCDGEYLASNGTAVQTEKPEGGYAYCKDGVLTLHDFEFTGMQGHDIYTSRYCVCIYSPNPVTIRLEGNNTINTIAEESDGWPAGILAYGLTITSEPGAVLNINSSRVGIYGYESDVDIVGSVLNIKAKHSGIDCNSSDLTITESTVHIESYDDGVWSNESITVTDSTLNIQAYSCIRWYTALNIARSELELTCNNGHADGEYYGDPRALCPFKEESEFNITLADGQTVKVATEPGGELVDYVRENNDTYKYARIHGHTAGADDGDCTTAITCSVCGEVMTAGAATHTGGTATCTEKAKCSVCNTEYGTLATHTPSADDGDCTTAITCSACGEVMTAGAAAHTGGTATCTEKAKCELCGKEYGEPLAHVDPDNDGSCDACGGTLSTEDGTAGGPADGTEPDTENGGGRGCISSMGFGGVAIIAILSLAAVGCKKKDYIKG